MKRKGRDFGKWGKNALGLTLLGLSLGLTPPDTQGAESIWSGGDSIVVGAGETVQVQPEDFHKMVDDINVASGGTLIILDDHQIGVMRNFVNNGIIKIKGSLTFNQNQVAVSGNGVIEIDRTNVVETPENGFYLGSNELKQLLEGNKIIVGVDEGVLPDNMEHGAFIQVDAGNTPESELAPIELKTTQFITYVSQQTAGTILMKDWASMRTGVHKTTIMGDKLNLGATQFSMDILANAPEHDVKESRMSRFRGGNITLVPATGDTVTLGSGVLQSGRGSAPGPEGITGLASNLKIGAEGKATLQIDGGALVLGGSGNDDGGHGTIEGNIIVGNAKSAAINSALVARTGDWTMKGDLTLEKSGYLEVGNRYIRDDGEVDPYLMKPASLDIDGVMTVNSPFSLNFANLVAKTLKTGEDGRIEIQNGGIISSNDFSLNGGIITFDPPFIADGDTSNASMGGLNFASNNVDGRINIGRNSMVTIGSTDYEWLRSQVKDYQTKNSLLWGRDITAALAIRSPQVLASNGGLNVDGTWTNGGTPATANVARFADKSLFVIDGSNLKTQTALDGNGTASLQVEKGAKLLITDVAMGDVIKVTDNFGSSSVSAEGWAANTATSTDVQNVESELVNPATGEYVVRVTEGKNSVDVFPALAPELAAVVDAARDKGLNTNANTAGRRFIARAVDNRFIGNTDAELAAATIESAARIAIAGAVPQMTKAANDAAGAAITQRTSLAQPEGTLQAVDQNGAAIQDNGLHANSFALWIMPLYQSTNGFGMEAGNFDYDFNGALGGVALGADYTFENMLRLGVSFNIGGGYARGTGDLNKTTNNMNFWGIGAYAGWTKNNFGLTADVNYTSTYNKLKQELPAQMEMSDLKGDISAWAISAGLRAEYKFETAYLDIIPHAGFRFMNLNSDSYDVKSNGSTVLNGDSFTQNIWTFPLGVSFAKNYQLENSWKVKPLLDLNVTPAAGDIKAKTNIRFSGIGQEAELDTKMMDYVSYGGTAGIEFGNDSLSFGVSYNGQFGAESSAHGVFGTFRYEF